MNLMRMTKISIQEQLDKVRQLQHCNGETDNRYKKASRDLVRAVVFPDIHSFNRSVSSWNVAKKVLIDLQPDIFIQLGDWADFPQISSHKIRSLEGLVSLTDEIKLVNGLIDDVEGCLPNGCTKIYLEGNHERRLQSFFINSWSPTAAALLGRKSLGTFDQEFNLDARGWFHQTYNKPYAFGDMLFKHGMYCNQHHASKNVTRGNSAFKNCIYGHTHTYQAYSVVGKNGQTVTATSIGTLSQLEEVDGYLDEETQPWVNMIAVVDFYDGYHSIVHPLKIVNGRTYYGKLYAV